MPEQERFRLADYDGTIREVLDSGGEFTLFPRGTSMLPLIVEGRDSVALVKADRLQPGDIAFYQRDNGQYVLHWIIGENDGTFTMCGDNQLSPEYGIKPEQLIAKAAYITRRGKKLTPRSLPYRVYVKLWNIFFIRRVYFKLLRIANGGKKAG